MSKVGDETKISGVADNTEGHLSTQRNMWLKWAVKC